MNYKTYYRNISKKIVVAIIACFLVCTLCASNINLEQKITIATDTTLYETLNILGDSLGVYFSYNADLFDADQKVKTNYSNTPAFEILNHLFSGKSLEYKIIGNQLVISKVQKVVQTATIVGKKTEKLLVKGIIVDERNEKAIPYATIGILGKMKWTVCNADGRFVLNIDKYDDYDTLQISCMGYLSKKIQLQHYINDSLDHIKLEQDLFAIQEVVIRKVNPMNLIKKAIENIPENYPDNLYGFKGFYRETIKKNKNYVSIAEALVEGRKMPYFGTHQSDQIKIIKARKLVDEQKHDTVLLKLQAGLYTSLQLDVIKNPSDFLNMEFFTDYNYQVSDIILSKNNHVYVMEFDRKGKSDYAYYKGKLYFDYTSGAILKVDFLLNKTGVHNAHKFLIVKKPLGLKVKVKGGRYNVNYTLNDDSLYCLNYISSETVFDIKQDNKLFGAQYTVKSELVITSYYDEDKRFSNSEIVKRSEIFTEQVDVYGTDFWNDYSIIPPEKSLLDALNDFQNNLGTENEKKK